MKPPRTPLEKMVKSASGYLKLLTAQNPKAAKGRKYGNMGAVLMLSPAKNSGFEMCSHRSAGCTLVCLNTAGRGGQGAQLQLKNSAIQRARIRRTLWLMLERKPSEAPPVPASFAQALAEDIIDWAALAEDNGYDFSFRLNGTSDLRWEDMPVEIEGGRYANIMEVFPTFQFYDYTKIPGRFDLPKNYHLTYSWNERPEAPRASSDYYNHRVNTAVVFDLKRNQALPAIWGNLPVIDGGASDLRFLDPFPCVVGLRALGKALQIKTGFVVHAPGGKFIANPPESSFDGGDLFPDI